MWLSAEFVLILSKSSLFGFGGAFFGPSLDVFYRDLFFFLLAELLLSFSAAGLSEATKE